MHRHAHLLPRNLRRYPPIWNQARVITTPTPLPRPYKIHISSSWAGKPESKTDRRYKVPFPNDSAIGKWRDEMLVKSSSRKLRDKETKDPGEDFFFVQQMRENSGVAFGVADGVGGWNDTGVDPSLFSQALCYNAIRYFRHGWPGEPEIDPSMGYEEREEIEGWHTSPIDCLDLAYGGVLREPGVQAGSSTACFLTLNAASGVLKAANLGDSGFSIIRGSSVLHKQPSQTLFFNCPKQLTKIPRPDPKDEKAMRLFSRSVMSSPAEADTYETKLRDGDVVVAYTDGFSDNVFPSEMLGIYSMIGRQIEAEEDRVDSFADALVDYARKCMAKRHKVSPFERDAAREGMFFQGGKVDDVTVIVAMIRETI